MLQMVEIRLHLRIRQLFCNSSHNPVSESAIKFDPIDIFFDMHLIDPPLQLQTPTGPRPAPSVVMVTAVVNVCSIYRSVRN